MNKLKEVYNLKNDITQIMNVQEASVDNSSPFGYQMESGLLFGTNEWFNAIDKAIIPKHTIKGKISKVFMSGHNDFPEFEVVNQQGKTSWVRKGDSNAYIIGSEVEIIYVELRFKKASSIVGKYSKCIISIGIENKDT